MKKRKILKKGLAVVLSAALVTGVLPEIHRVDAFAQTVVATMPGITAYATAEQLKDANNFTLHTDNGNGIAQKVNFGTRQGGSQTWYIAGYDESTSGLVMICNPEAEMSNVDFSYQSDNITADIQGQYEGETPTEVGANHYGNSALRERLGTLVNDCFTAKEQTFMLNPTVYTYDTLNTTTYSTSDKLYAPYGEAENTYITVGINSPENLTAGIKVGITSENAPSGSPFSKEIGEEVIDEEMGVRYSFNYDMPLRTPANVNNASVQYYTTSAYVKSASARITLYVVPAFHLDIDTVLFGSAAAAGTVDATISDSMTLRYDGSSMIESEANSCSQDMIRVTKGTQDDEYLYIQWEDDGSNQVYVTQITEDFALSAETVGVDSFENCKVWLETVYDGVAFAKEMSNEHELPDAFDANGFKQCSICQETFYEPAQKNNQDYYEICNAGQLYWFAGVVNNDSKVCDYNQETNPQGTKQNAYANAILMNDIVLNEELLSNRNEDGTFADGYEPRSWTPIREYNGTFEGGSHIIKGVYIDTDSPYMGLFGYVSGAKIKNLGVEDSYVKGKSSVGGLVASSNSSICVIDHCYYSGIVSGGNSVGGITGFGKGKVTNCYSEGTISGSSNYPMYIGGITGCCFYNLSIENCYSTADITGNSATGGIAGYMKGDSDSLVTIKNCYYTGSLQANSRYGNICGETEYCRIENCYYTHETGIGKKDEYSVEENVCRVTDAQMTDGYVAYALQSNQAEQNGVVPKVWGQILSGTHKQNAPVLFGETVYRTEDTEGETYSNYVQQLGIGSQDGILSDIWYAFVPADTGYYSFAGDSGVNICLVSDLGKDIEWKDAGDSPVYLLSEAHMYYVMVKNTLSDASSIQISCDESIETVLSVGDNTLLEDADVDIWYEFTPEETGRYAFVNTSMEGSLLLGESKEEYSSIQLSTLPTYNMEAGKTYYVKTESTAGEHNITINKIKESLSLGTNTIGVSSSENIWYAFTPEEDGMYEFDAMLIDGDMYVNEDKSSQGKASLADIPIYNLSKDVTYYVNVQSSAGVHDFIVRKLNTSLAEGWNRIRISDPYIWYTFVPEKSGTYRFSNLAEDERLVLNRDRGEEGESQTNEPVYALNAEDLYYVRITRGGERLLNIEFVDTITRELAIGSQTLVAAEPTFYYSFTPDTTGVYSFSVDNEDAVLMLNGSNRNRSSDNDYVCALRQGVTYEIAIVGVTGNVNVTLALKETITTQLSVGETQVYVEPGMFWYEFTPEEDGTYLFSSRSVTSGGIYVNTDMTDSNGAGMGSYPAYDLKKGVKYYVGIQCSTGKFDLSIEKWNLVLTGKDDIIVSGNMELWYAFTPETSGLYQFSSETCQGSLYLSESKERGSSKSIMNKPTYDLTAGTTYYVNINYSSGEYDLTITKLKSDLKVGNNTVYAGDNSIWYEFTPETSGLYQFSSETCTGGMYLSESKEQSSSKGMTNKPVYELAAGTKYYVNVQNTPANYDLTITKLKSDIEVGNNTVYAGDNSIWYAFTPVADGLYQFSSETCMGRMYLNDTKVRNISKGMTDKPTYDLAAGKTYYVNIDFWSGEYDLTITKLKSDLEVGDNMLYAGDNSIWYAFTPVADGLYQFSSETCGGNIYLNETKERGAYKSVMNKPIYDLAAGKTYYVNINYSSNEYKFTITKLKSDLEVGDNTVYAGDNSIWYAFTPVADGLYQFSSETCMGGMYLSESKERGSSKGIMNKPIYDLTAGTTYYVNVDNTLKEYDLKITKLKTDIEVGNNTVYAGDVDGWYEFTPNQSGTYMFSSSITGGYITVNTDKGDEGKELITSSPIYSLTKDTTYKVRIGYSPGEVDLNIQQIQWTAEVSVVVGGENADEIAEYFPGAGTYNHGDSIRFIAIDAPCNEFLGWYDAKDLDDNNQIADAEPLSTNYVFVTLADKDYSVVAVYEETVHSGVTTVKNHKKATPEKSGYTGDLVCKCGEVLEKGTVINRPKYLKGISSGYLYTGSPITPAVTVKDWKGNVISDSHYKVEYHNNTLPGVAKVVVTFDSEDYTGTMEQEFNITVPKTSITSVKNGSAGKITTVWKTRAAVDGYYVMVKDEQGKLVKSRKYAGSDVKTATFSGLEKGKTYRVYVRTYVKTDDQTYYSEWSPVEKITLEK